MKLARILSNGALLTLMLGHFTNDLMGGVLPMLFPEIKDRFDLDNAAVGLITLAYSSASSISQPFFGYVSDRFERRWFVPVPLVWGACFVALYGFADSYGVILVLAALAGIGSGAYHPLGASNAAAVSAERDRNTALSVYTAGGTTGYALGPLVAVAFLAVFGTEGTAVLFVPALLVAALIYSQTGRVERARAATASVGEAETGPIELGMLARVIGVVMLRSWVIMAPLQFVAVWYDDLGYRSAFYGALVTTVIISGVAGTIGGGMLADKYGARRIVVGSLLLGIAPLLLFAGIPGPIAFASGALLGICFDSSLSVTLVAAQRLLPGRTGIASGVILGLGFITGGLGVPITGRIADEVGIQTAVASLSVLAVLAALLAMTIPWERLGSRYDEREFEPQWDGRLRNAEAPGCMRRWGGDAMRFGRVEGFVRREDGADGPILLLTVSLETNRTIAIVREESLRPVRPVETDADLAWHADQWTQETIGIDLAEAGWEVVGAGEVPAPEPGTAAASAAYAVRNLS